MSRIVGYSRELAPGLGTEADAEQLRRAGATLVFADDESADSSKRAGLRECLDSLQPGDTLIVTSAAILAPTVPQFQSTVTGLTARGAAFRSLSDPLLSAGGQADPVDVIAALESLKQRLSSLQTRAGMASAAGEGRRPGRPTVMTPERVAMAVELRNLGRPVTHIARVLGVSANAVQRSLAASSEES